MAAVRSAMLHVLGDLLGSAAAITAALTVYFTGWPYADPLLAVVIAAHQEADRIGPTVTGVREAFPGALVVVADDGSDDGCDDGCLVGCDVGPVDG
jgi:hypothetical protein